MLLQHAEGGRADALDLGPDLSQQLHHHADVADAGMLVSTHSSVVSRRAASSGSAAFLFPSTSIVPEIRRPPRSANSTSEISQRDNFFTKRHAEPLEDTRAAQVDRISEYRRRWRALVDGEVAVGRRDAGAAPVAHLFRPTRSTSAPADAGTPTGTWAASGF